MFLLRLPTDDPDITFVKFNMQESYYQEIVLLKLVAFTGYESTFWRFADPVFRIQEQEVV